MNKNKKLISLVCAIAMIISIFSGLTIAYAENEGFTFSDVKLDDTGKVATVVVGYTGLESGLQSGKFVMELPATVTAVTKKDDAIIGKATLNTDELPTIQYSFAADGDNADSKKSSGTITTLTITFGEEVTDDVVLKMEDGSNLYDYTDTKRTVGTNLAAGSGTIHNDNAPTPKPTTTAKPADVATEPEDEDKPVIKPDVTATKGFTISDPEVSEDGTTVKVAIGYTGLDNGLQSGKFVIEMPSNVKAVSKKDDAIIGKATLNTDELPTIQYSFAADGDNADSKKTSGTITTLTLTVTPVDYDTQIEIGDGSNLYDYTDTKYTVGGSGDNALEATNKVLPAYTGDEPEPQDVVDTVDLRDAITKTVTDTPDDTSKESDYFIIPKVTVVDPETKEVVDAEYGEQGDYVAVIGDTVLTPAQYSNLINGYLGADNVKDIVAANNINNINDVISKIGLRVYNSTAKISAQLVNKTTKEIENADDEEISVDTTPPTFTATSLKLTNSGKKTATVGKEVTNTLTIKTGSKNDEDYTFGKATFQLTEESLNILPLAGVQISFNEIKLTDEATVAKSPIKVTTSDKIELPESADGKYTITFTPTGTGTVSYNVTYSDAYDRYGELVENGLKDSVTYAVSAAKSNGSGSSSSSSSSKDDDNKSSGGGAIATGLVDSGSGYIPSLGFDDLGDVEWAQTAINSLAAKKIVSGVGDNKFDPNAALTRAAYAQMLVNAIGHNEDSADVEFDDVPTDAWFYHNVAVAAQLGIVAGFGDGSFRPYDLITREQMALMTQKAAVVMSKSLVGADAGTFTDDADIADWSRDAVYQLSNAGIINGMGDGSFAPQANATRAQAAVIIYNTFVK